MRQRERIRRARRRNRAVVDGGQNRVSEVPSEGEGDAPSGRFLVEEKSWSAVEVDRKPEEE